MSSELLDRLTRTIEAIPLVDTHEHLIDEARRAGQDVDLFSLIGDYPAADLVSAGMPTQVLMGLADPIRPLDARWREFSPFWDRIRWTGYGRALLLAVRDLYGTDTLDESTYGELSERITAANAVGWYEHVLKKCANIEVAANQPIPEFDPTPIAQLDQRYFVPVISLDDFVTPWNHTSLQSLEKRSGLAIHSLADLQAAIGQELDRGKSAGVVAIKILLAYRRSLRFENVTTAEAEHVFNRLGRYPTSWLPDLREPAPVSWEEARPLQDYLVHYLVRRCGELGLPIQVHTGLQYGNGNELANSNPVSLTNLFQEYPEARFDIFHAGYPFQGVTAALGKMFPNVYVDLCWVHLISPWVGRQILHEWIETVPANKIFAFGGDATMVEWAYAHSRIARANVARVLTEKVEAGDMGEEEALYLARMILRTNAREFLGLAEPTAR